MSERESKFVLPDVCPMCGKQKPCVLHDRVFKDALLGEEEAESIYDLFETRELAEYDNTIFSIASLSESSFVVGGKGGKVKLYSRVGSPVGATPEGSVWTSASLEGYGNDILNITPLSETAFVVGGEDGEVKLYSRIDSVWKPESLEGYGNNISSIASLSESSFVVGGKSGKVKLYSRAGSPVGITPEGSVWKSASLEGYGNNIWSITPLSESSFLVGGSGGEVKLYSRVGSVWTSASLEGYGNFIWNITPLSESSFVVGGNGGNVKLYSRVGSVWTSASLEEYGNNIRSIIHLSESSFVVGGWGGEVKLYSRVGSVWTSESLEGYGDIIENITPLSESNFVVGGRGGKVKLYEILEDKLRAYHERQLAKTEEPVPELSEV